MLSMRDGMDGWDWMGRVQTRRVAGATPEEVEEEKRRDARQAKRISAREIT